MPVTQDHLSSIKATQCEWRPVTGINICNMMMWMMIIMLWGWKIRYRRLSRRERCRVRWHKGAAPLLWVDIVLPAGMTTHCFHRTQYRIVLTPISWGAPFSHKAGSLNHWLKKRLVSPKETRPKSSSLNRTNIWDFAWLFSDSETDFGIGPTAGLVLICPLDQKICWLVHL